MNPRQWAIVFAVTLFHVALNYAKTKRGSLTTIQSQPRLGLVVGGVVARSNATPLPGRLPLDQRADGPPSRRPSRRADEPPSAQAPGIRAPLVRTDPKDRLRRAPRMRSQDSAVSRLSPPLIAHSLTRLAICSGQKSHPGFCRRNRNHPGSGRRATTLTRSDHPTATGESAPSVMTPTPKSKVNTAREPTTARCRSKGRECNQSR